MLGCDLDVDGEGDLLPVLPNLSTSLYIDGIRNRDRRKSESCDSRLERC